MSKSMFQKGRTSRIVSLMCVKTAVRRLKKRVVELGYCHAFSSQLCVKHSSKNAE